MAIMLMELYPCDDAMNLVTANPGQADEGRRISALKSLVEAYLYSSAPPTDLIVIEDARDHAECAHFICSDFFPFVPLCSSDCDKMMGGVDKALAKEGFDINKEKPMAAIHKILGKSMMIPFCMSRHLCAIFDRVF